jgi:hypothetical protein
MIDGFCSFLFVAVMIIAAPRFLIALICFVKSGGTDVWFIMLGCVATFFGPTWIDEKIKAVIVLVFHAVTGKQLVVERVVEKIVEKPVEKVRVRTVREIVRVRDMTKDEAISCLGWDRVGDVDAAYRTMMKRVHPDHGGSNYLAQVVNQARQQLGK